MERDIKAADFRQWLQLLERQIFIYAFAGCRIRNAGVKFHSHLQQPMVSFANDDQSHDVRAHLADLPRFAEIHIETYN